MPSCRERRGTGSLVRRSRRIGVSTRTLQRRLEDEGTSFNGIIDGIRREIALELITDPAMTVRAVAHCVGYSDQYAFHRAFRRWTGCSPSAYRRQAAIEDVDPA